MVDNVVWGEPHSKEGTGRMEVAGHSCAAVHILTNTLHGRQREGEGEKRREGGRKRANIWVKEVQYCDICLASPTPSVDCL